MRGMMKIVRKTALVGQVWLTAAMTLIAGVPHFSCRCPDGHVKPFCLGLAPGGRACCDRPCCSPVPDDGLRDRALDPVPAAPAGKTCCCCCDSVEAEATSRLPAPE